MATEFASPEELKQYLKDHPNADPQNHSVSEGDKGKAEDKAEAPKKVPNKLPGVSKKLSDASMKQIKWTPNP